jgi:lincosamide nucleotidyltransferase A/C/D/E
VAVCCVVLPLVPLAVGDVVDRSVWVPHVTLVGDVRMPGGGTDAAAAVLRATAARIGPLRLVVGAEAASGPHGSVLVDLVDSPVLRPLHEGLLDALEREVDGVEVIAPGFAGEGYRPHRTVASGARPAPDDVLDSTTVALVELDPDGRSGTGVVLAVFELGSADVGAETGEETVLAVLDALRAAGAPGWVIGGWGVDALAGRRTRAHHDLDLFVDAAHVDGAVEALAQLGFVVRFAWSENRWTEHSGRLVPSAFVAVDAAGREVDVHTVEVVGRQVASVSASTVPLPAGALDGVGTIGGVPVPCATAAAQRVMHTGYPLPDRQLADVALLERPDP